MVIQILVPLLILGIAFYQAIQGMFSAMIMAILTILSTAIAFEYYEPLAALLYGAQPAYAQAIALIALFVIPLLILRTVADLGIRGNVVLGNDMASVWIGRVVAGGIGLLTGTILTGVLMIAVQFLPVRPSILGYMPHNDKLERHSSLAPFYPDRFVLGLVKLLSEGSLSSQRSYAVAHDDLVKEAFCNRNTDGKLGRLEAPVDSLRVLSAEPEDKPKPELTANLELDFEKQRVWRVLIAVDKSARDEDDIWRLPGTHFRLVTRGGRSYYPINGFIAGLWDVNDREIPTTTPRRDSRPGEATHEDAILRHVEPPWSPKTPDVVDRLHLAAYAKLPPARQDAEPRWLLVEWVYALNEKDVPQYVVFRRIAKSAVPVRED